MTHTLIIAARELQERKFVLAVAAFIATVPFIILNLKGSQRAGGFEMISAVGSVAAVSFALALALILGASIVGRDLSERRLTFYFARPVSGASIWFGKLIGGIVLTALSFAVIFIPTFLAGRRTWYRGLTVEPESVVFGALGAAVILFLLSHAISTTTRSRSGLAAVDLIAGALAAGITWMIVSSLLGAMAIGLIKIIAVTLLIAVVVALGGAGAWQLSRGRADVKRSHVEMSKFLWITMAAVLAVIGAYTAWVFAAGITDLDKARAFQSSRGDWTFVEGTSRFRGDFRSVFLLNLANGESIRYPTVPWSGPSFNRNGTATVTQAVPGKRGDVVVHRFGRDSRPLLTGITEGGDVVLSDDLNRLAIIGSKTVSIHEIDSQRLIASAAMPPRRSWQGTHAFFVTPDVLRIVLTDKEDESIRVAIMEMNAAKRQFVETGRWTTTGRAATTQAMADGGTLVVHRFGTIEGSRVALLDGRTAAVRGTIATESAGYWGVRVLADGRIAVITAGPEQTLRLFAPDGSSIRDIPLGPAARSRIISETASAQLIVGLHSDKDWKPGSGGWETVVVDLNGGRITRRERDFLPAYHWWSIDPRPGMPNRSGELVVIDAAGALWRWNATTGEKTKLI